jgi:hypothetical protein
LILSARRFWAFAELVLVVGILFSCVSLASAKDVSGSFSRLVILSPAPVPVTNVIFGLFVFVLIVVVLIALAFVHVLRRHWKKISVAALVLIAVVAGFYIVWSSEASIYYWFVAPGTTATQDNYLTMYCENTGRLAGTFDLEIAFTNAHVSMKTSLPYQLHDSQTIKFTFTLHPGEQQSRQMWFIINQNVTDFYINLSFHQNDGNFLVRSSSGGVDSVSYQKDVNGGNFTMRVFMPPP